jgi:MFS family permease
LNIVAYEEFSNIIWTLISILSALSAILSVFVLNNLRKHKHKGKEETKRVLLIFFSLMALGYILWAIAENLWDFYSYILGVEFPGLSIADFFWIVGYIPMIAGFIYCWIKFYNEQERKSFIISIALLASIVISLVLFYILNNLILPYNADYNLLEQIVNVSYPILSSILFISSIIVYFLFEKQTIRTPMILISLSVLFAVFGDILYYNYAWTETYGIMGIFSDTFYVIEYLLSSIAFYLFYNKSKPEHVIEKTG